MASVETAFINDNCFAPAFIPKASLTCCVGVLLSWGGGMSRGLGHNAIRGRLSGTLFLPESTIPRILWRGDSYLIYFSSENHREWILIYAILGCELPDIIICEIRNILTNPKRVGFRCFHRQDGRFVSREHKPRERPCTFEHNGPALAWIGHFIWRCSEKSAKLCISVSVRHFCHLFRLTIWPLQTRVESLCLHEQGLSRGVCFRLTNRPFLR